MSDTLKSFKEAYKNLTPDDILKLFEFCGTSGSEPMCEPDIWQALEYGEYEYVCKEDSGTMFVRIYSGLSLPHVDLKLQYDDPDEENYCKLTGYEVVK